MGSLNEMWNNLDESEKYRNVLIGLLIFLVIIVVYNKGYHNMVLSKIKKECACPYKEGAYGQSIGGKSWKQSYRVQSDYGVQPRTFEYGPKK